MTILSNNSYQHRYESSIEETTRATKVALERIVKNNVLIQSSDSRSFIKYKPLSKQSQSEAFNSAVKERIISMVEMPVDPLQPPKFKHKRVPRGSCGLSEAVPVMHSPSRCLTVKDQQDWKIPPSISNWKNPNGYSIPLDKRLAADHGTEEVGINANFATLLEALYVAEQKAIEAVGMRSKIRKEIAMKESENKEQVLRALAAKARSERTATVELGRERKRGRGLETKVGAVLRKKSKITRDGDRRDVSENVALGMASVGAGRGEVMYDQRLFNQDKGIASGCGIDDDQYTVYDKGLCTAQATLHTLYQPKKDLDAGMYGGADQQLEKIRNTKSFIPDKGFRGASEIAGKRGIPVEFEQAEEVDLFGLGQFATEMKRGKKAISVPV